MSTGLDDLCVRFIINLPPEELASVERICFQVEEAQWFYEDFIRPLDPTLPSLNLKQFSLRIFQHCPLFSQWSAQHHTTAFAEFLAYKQRVPVRGAIMLNENMDEVVLVKGWKKGANWSFPRGKINKDEDDLDCAVREVYEETGFDIQSAGLVKPEKDMKYIEVTMREQHMRLYVFRGVPKDTYFEPRTRKEISKIEWYRLNDLPTQKKKNHHDGHEESLAVNANKFYMVAPFLHPLKKWIAQQKKKENRFSSNLAAPPIYADEGATEYEQNTTGFVTRSDILSPNIPSSLPEVANAHNQPHLLDPTTHLKELLKIGGSTSTTQNNTQPVLNIESGVPKSNALLDLLRNGSTSQTQVTPISASNQVHQRSSITSMMQHMPEQPRITRPAQGQTMPAMLQGDQRLNLQSSKQSLLLLFSKAPVPAPSLSPTAQNITTPQTHPSGVSNPGLSQPVAPYQKTGDPHFARSSSEESRTTMVPPANVLPKLTQHTRALLGSFSVALQSQPQVQAPPPPPLQQPQSVVSQGPMPLSKQALLDVFKSAKPDSTQTQTTNKSTASPVFSETSKTSPATHRAIPATQVAQAKPSINLADLFKRPPQSQPVRDAQVVHQPQVAPVELAAAPVQVPTPQPVISENEMLASLFKKDKTDQPKRQRSLVTKAGHTGATIDALLNQPQFESIATSQSQSVRSIHRSPVNPHRTLFNPKQPTPMKILSRDDSKQTQPTRSPRPQKVNVAAAASPRRNAPTKEKPFQPQILRRPQNAVSQEALLRPPPALQTGSKTQPQSIMQRPVVSDTPPSPNPDQLRVMSPIQVTNLRRPSQQSDPHKQSLLSIFSAMSTTSPNSTRAPKPISTSGMVSPITQSQLVSPIGDEPISTRSRVGSLASITSAGPQHGGLDGRPKVEKRQTNAGDKAFLLGYLGRIANQEAE